MKLIRMGILCLIGMLAVSFSNVAFAAPNTAPVLDSSKSPVLSTISEDPGAPTGSVGTLVSSLVDFAVPMGQVDNISDGDVGAVTGIAVTTIDSSLTCYYSLNAGTTWTAFGSVSATTARLLASNSANRIYCLPGININGSFPAALTFRAWDQTSGTDGGTADVSINGNDTAFSSATDTISLQVTPVNDPPVAVDDEYTITENASSTILYILNNDYDVDAVLPIALSSAPSANHGVAAFGVDYITYTPDTDYCGDDTFNYLVIDSDGGSDTGTVTVHITCSDTETETPTLEIAAQQSGDSFITTETMHITFTLPEDMLHYSLVLTFTPAVGDPITLDLMDAVSGQPNTFDLPLNDIRSVPEVRSASAAVIPAGEYTISISYRDTSENPSATASITGIPITNPVVVVTPTVVSSGRSTPWTPITPGSSTNSSSSSSAGQGSSHEKYHFPRTLKQGMKGDDVVILQNFLKVTPVASKHFGPKTKAALIDFQRTHGLTADGIAGPKTFAVIESMI